VNEFTYALGDEGQGAVRELLGRAASAGLVPPVAPSSLELRGDGVH
jgi:1,4-dihydroxy-6-naphthoate synthase